jgi:hypothetical protein
MDHLVHCVIPTTQPSVKTGRLRCQVPEREKNKKGRGSNGRKKCSTKPLSERNNKPCCSRARECPGILVSRGVLNVGSLDKYIFGHLDLENRIDFLGICHPSLSEHVLIHVCICPGAIRFPKASLTYIGGLLFGSLSTFLQKRVWIDT